MTTTPSPERQPADAGGERDAFESWYCQDAAKLGLSFSPSELFNLREGEDYGSHRVAINSKWEGWQGRAALSIPAPQAQPDARAVEGEPVAWRYRHTAFKEPYWIYVDHVPGPLLSAPDYEIQPLYLSAPAADDGWRPSREEVAKRVYEAMRWAARHAEDKPAPEWVEGGNSDAQYQARREADRILALHPAAPTDDVGKS